MLQLVLLPRVRLEPRMLKLHRRLQVGQEVDLTLDFKTVSTSILSRFFQSPYVYSDRLHRPHKCSWKPANK